MSITAMRQALEALGKCRYRSLADEIVDPAITALRTAIEAAEKQEPVALEAVYETIIHWDEGGGKRSRRELARRIVDLYTIPPAAQREPAPGYCKHCKQYTIEEPLPAPEQYTALEQALTRLQKRYGELEAMLKTRGQE